MILAFTICSNNYLAQAKTLGDSLLRFNPEVKFVIGLCDAPDASINYREKVGFEIIPFEELGLNEFDELVNKYRIVELNTAIKPSFFKHLVHKYSEFDKIIYFDPDIEIFSSIAPLSDYLNLYDIVITPHILKPPPLDNLEPGENLFMMYGIFNLGFLALKKSGVHTGDFLDWWESRTLKLGISDIENGYYVDQLWINMAPVYYDKVLILKEPGYNVAPWNLHEREITVEDHEKYRMHDGSELVFFHFSSFNYQITDRLAKFFTRYNYHNASDTVKAIYNSYREKMLSNGVEFFSKIDYKYGLRPLAPPPRPGKLREIIYLMVPPVLLKVYYHVKMFFLRFR